MAEDTQDGPIRFVVEGESPLRDNLVWLFGRRASMAGHFHAENDALLELHRLIGEEIERARREGAEQAFDEGMWAAYNAERDGGDGSEVPNPYRASGARASFDVDAAFARNAVGSRLTQVGDPCSCGALDLKTTVSERHDRGLHAADRCIGSHVWMNS